MCVDFSASVIVRLEKSEGFGIGRGIEEPVDGGDDWDGCHGEAAGNEEEGEADSAEEARGYGAGRGEVRGGCFGFWYTLVFCLLLPAPGARSGGKQKT